MITLSQILSEQDLEKRKQLIDSKIMELEQIAEQGKELDLDAVHKGFISTSDTIQFSADLIDINDNPISSRYTMKSTDYFYEFVEYLKQNNVKDMMSALYAVSPFLRKYFGVNPDYTTKNNRSDAFDTMGMQLSEIQEKHGNEVFNEYFSKWFDISIFKGNSMAECTEYAALTQNLYSFMGANTYYVAGEYSSDITKEAHAYNLVQLGQDAFYIVDSANPTITYDMDFNIVDSKPRIQQISRDDFVNAVNGEGLGIEVKTCNFQVNPEGKTRRIDVMNCAYGIKAKTNLKSK